MTIRPATLAGADLEAIVDHRRAMFRDMGYRTPARGRALYQSLVFSATNEMRLIRPR